MKSKNLILVGTLVALIAVYFLVDVTGNKGRSKSTKSELVNLNVDEITQINVKAKDKSVALDKKDENWQVKLPNGKWTPATESSIKGTIDALVGIKPSRLASKKKAKWKEYQVDSLGTEVKVYQGSDLVLNIVLGKFAMEGQNSFSTFVRLADEQEVYNVKNFMPYAVPSDANSYRNKTLTKINKDSISEVQFTYPSDSGFVLTKHDELWTVLGQETDSIAITKYFNSLSNLNSSNFYDEEFNRNGPKSLLTFDFINGERVTIVGYQVDGEWVIQSSENLNAWFKDDNLFSKMHKSVLDFVK